MKEVFENRKKIYLFSLFLFLISSIIIRLLPNDLGNIITCFLFPLYFITLVLLYLRNNRIDYNVPIMLTIIYIIVGYIVIPNIINSNKIVHSFLFGLLPLVTIKIYSKIKKIEIKEKKPLKLNDKQKKIISYSMPFIGVLLLELYYSICTFNILHLPTAVVPALLGLLIAYSLFYIFLTIFRRTDVANIILIVLLFTIYIINEGRIYYTSDTLQITDILFLQNATEVAGMADNTFLYCINYLFFPTVLTAIFAFYLIHYIKISFIKIKNFKNQIVKGLIAVAILVLLFIPNEPFNKFLVTHPYNIYNSGDPAITASNTRYYKKYGVLPGLYGKLIESRTFKPDGYNQEELVSLLNKAEKVEGTWKKPNIIVVFSESYWDLSKLEDVKFDKDINANYHKLQNEGKFIEMIAPAYGGMSSNVEFEIMTGGSLNYFSKGYTPYMQFFKDHSSEDDPNIIRELKTNGYKTKVLNSSSAIMFNCARIYTFFYGIDEQTHLYDELQLEKKGYDWKTNGTYVTDAYLTDMVEDYFDNKPADEKIFYFVITMGGHMPYYEEKYDKYDVNIVESPYNDDINGVIHSYAEGIYLADKELGRLYDYINTLDEDTIIVFFGDHLPHLSISNGEDALFSTGFLDYDYNLESVYKQYNTSALILSNYDIEFDDTKYLSPDLLFTYILNNMDLDLSPYYKWLYSTKDVLPSSNFVVSQDNSGTIYYTLELSGEMKEVYDLRRNMQYMLFK
jgi:hypothetical protein